MPEQEMPYLVLRWWRKNERACMPSNRGARRHQSVYFEMRLRLRLRAVFCSVGDILLHFSRLIPYKVHRFSNLPATSNNTTHPRNMCRRAIRAATSKISFKNHFTSSPPTPKRSYPKPRERQV